MAFDRQCQLIRVHPATIIADTEVIPSAIIGFDDDVPRACIECVFDQFLDRSRRALHHLTGRNTVDGFGRKETDSACSVRA